MLNKYYKIILAVLLLVVIAHYVVVFMGVYENDDVAYMRLAHQLSTKHFLNLSSYNHFEHRWLTIFFTAIFYTLFGVNDYSSSAFGLICCLLSFYIVYKLISNESKAIILIASFLFLFNRATIFHIHRTLADAPMMLIVLSSIANYMQLKFGKNCNEKWQGMLLGLLILFGILAKETIVIVAPLWLYFFIIDIKNKRHTIFWLYTILSTLTLVFAYIAFYKIETGQWFYRIDVLFKNNLLNPCSYDVLPIKHTIERITIGLIDSFIHGSYMLLYLPAICFVVYKKQVIAYKPKLWFLSKVYIILLLCSNFMSISYKNYMPLCPDARHFIFLIPIAAILSSYMLFAYFTNAKKYWLLLFLFIVVSVRMYCIAHGVLQYLYLPATIILLLPFLFSFFKIKFKYNTVLLIAFLGYYSAISLHTFIVEPYPYYAQQKKCIDYLLQQKLPTILYCNNAETLDNSEYMYRFDKRNIELKLLNENDLNSYSRNYKQYYLINYNNINSLVTQSRLCLNNRPYLLKEGNVYLFEISSEKDLQYFLNVQNCTTQ